MNNQINQTFTSNIIDLLEIQRSSFYNFLFHGIYKELNSLIINPFFLYIPEQRPYINTVLKELHFQKEGLPIKQKIKENNLNFLFSKDLTDSQSSYLEQKNYLIENESQVITADIYIYPAKIKIKGPLRSLSSCIELEETYATSIYLQGEIIQKFQIKEFIPNIYKTRKQKNLFSWTKKGVLNLKLSSNLKSFQNSKISIKKYFYLATIPFLTEDGSFFINGCERVVINQIIRSPGIYFRKEYLNSQKTNYTATFISDNWTWAKFTLDNSISYSTKLNKTFDIYSQDNFESTQFNKEKSKIPSKYDVYINLNEAHFWREIYGLKDIKENSNELLLVDLILNLGFTIEEIFDNLQFPEKLSIPDILKESKLVNSLQQNISQEIFDKNLDKLDLNNQENKTILLKRLLDHIFAETEEKPYFSLGELGRYRINKRLGLNLPLTAKFLTALDFLKIIDCLIKLREENLTSDDIDDLKNKQIRGVGTLIQSQFRLALFRWLKHPRHNDETFFELHSSNLFENNLLLNSKKKASRVFLNSFILSGQLRTIIDKSLREFFLTSQLSQYFDETNPLAELAHKRRISVFGPDGLQRAKINTKIRDIHPSQYGKICPVETPEGENAGLVMSLASFARINRYGWIESPYLVVEKGQILTKTKPFYLNPHQEEHYTLAFGNNPLLNNGKILSKTVAIKEGSYFSETEAQLIDFSALSQLQILSIGTALVPFVEHNDANRALMGSNMQRQAVPLIFRQAPFIGTGLEPNVAEESGLVLKSESEGEIEHVSSTSIEIRDFNNQKITYKLKKYYRSNQETCNNQTCFFWPGEKVYAGQIIADSPATIHGELSLGANLLIGYLPWEGYNYEDAIVINERLVTQNILTSAHISTYQTIIKPSKIALQKINNILKTTRKIRELKKIFRKLKNLAITGSNSSQFGVLFKKISRQIIKNKDFLIERLVNSLPETKQIVGEEKMNSYFEKTESYLKRNLSSNGIIKVGSDVIGGDVLVSKFQVISNSGSKSSYQKLFEDLQKNLRTKTTNTQNNLVKQNTQKKEGSFYLIKQEKQKLKKTLNYIKSLNKTVFKMLLILKRLLALSQCLDNILNNGTFETNILNAILFKKSLKIKYLIKKKHLNFLIQALSLEIKKKKKMGSSLTRLLKFLIKNFYQKLYNIFYFSQSKIFNFQNFKKLSKFKKQLFATKLYSCTQILNYIYSKANQKILNTLTLSYSMYTQNSVLVEKYLSTVIQNIPEILQKTFLFDVNSFNFFANELFFTQLTDFKKFYKNFQTHHEKINFETIQGFEQKNTSLLLPLGTKGKVIDVKILPLSVEESSLFATGFLVKIVILENRKIQIGDKLSGRHGNKGVISRILPKADMPTLPNGTTLDILVNPLGVPSRMNVGQLLECMLGLSSLYLGTRLKIVPFDEVFGTEASRILATQKLKQAAQKTKNSWLYENDAPGKIYLQDGRTGEFFDNPITVGVAYILKLIHLVDDKMHSRALGPYNRVTEQPLQGKAAYGGQRFGEMEVWALEAYGCANTLQELLTIKSDDIDGRNDLYQSLSSGKKYNKPNPNFSETLLTLIRELNSLGLDFQFFRSFSPETSLLNQEIAISNNEVKIFNLLEERLKLRFIVDNIKFRYLDFHIKNQNLQLLTQIENQTKILFEQLKNF